VTEAAGPTVWTRPEAIARLRAALLSLTDEDHSICQVAAEKGIFCRGFRRWHDSEFDRRWRSLLGSSTHLTRGQVEQLANLWQLAEQIRQRVGLACDALTAVPGACRGWDDFSNEDLARHCRDLLEKEVRVLDSEPHGSLMALAGPLAVPPPTD
jgi:hypothetical protein